MTTDADFIVDSYITFLAANTTPGGKIDKNTIVRICRPLVFEVERECEVLLRVGFEDDISLITTADGGVVYWVEYLHETCKSRNGGWRSSS